MTAFSYSFLDWIRARLLDTAGDVLTEDTLFFHRDLDIVQRIKSNLAKIGWFVEVSHATTTPEENDTPNNRFADMAVEVTITRSILSKYDTCPLAESLYAAFVGASTRRTPLPRVGDVWVSELSASVDASTGSILHSFTITTKIDLSPAN